MRYFIIYWLVVKGREGFVFALYKVFQLFMQIMKVGVNFSFQSFVWTE